MTSTFNALLSDVYRLLSLYDEEDFIAASQSFRVDPQIRDVLRAFAKPAREARLSSRLNESRSSSVQPAQSDTEISDQLTKVLVEATKKLTTDKVFEIFVRNGIDVSRKPKESKERVAKRLVSLVSSLNPSRRRKILQEVGDAAGGQTAGWISVLRNRG